MNEARYCKMVALALSSLLVCSCARRYEKIRDIPLPPSAVRVNDSLAYITVRPGHGGAIGKGQCFGETSILQSHQPVFGEPEEWRGISSFDEATSEWKRFYEGMRDGEHRRVWQKREYASGKLGRRRQELFTSDLYVSGVNPCR